MTVISFLVPVLLAVAAWTAFEVLVRDVPLVQRWYKYKMVRYPFMFLFMFTIIQIINFLLHRSFPAYFPG